VHSTADSSLSDYELREMQQLREENAHLRRMVANRSQAKSILEERRAGTHANFRDPR